MNHSLSRWAAILWTLCAPAWAQETTALLRGAVTDPSGARLAGADVRVESPSTGWRRQTVADAEGVFLLPLLPAGVYDLHVEAPGFRPYLQRGLRLTVAQAASVEVRLELGPATETVLVTADIDEVNTVRGAIGQVLDARSIRELPLHGRNYLQLAVLQPGVAPRMVAITESTPVLPGQQTFSANGLRPQSNNFLLDGADNNDSVLGSAAAVPSPDALEEFRILTNAYSAEYGRGAGAVVSVLTRRGSNDWHGAAYNYLRNRVFDARNFFAPDVPALIRNQFGGSLGGPARRDRTFFFVNYEGLRQKQGAVLSATVLSAAERQGDFSQSFTKPRDPATGQAFPGHLIPTTRISPIARNILALIPQANVGASTLISQLNTNTRADQGLARADHQVSSRNTLTARYQRQAGTIAKPNTFPPPVNIPGFPFEDNFSFHNLAFSDTHTFGANLLNEFRVNLNRIHTLNNHPAYRIEPAGLGFNYPVAGRGNLPMILMSGLTAFGTSTSTDALRRDTAFQLQDHVSYVSGWHSWKLGFAYYHNQFSLREDSAVNGSFNFTGGISGTAASDFLLGLATRFSQATAGQPAYFRSNWFQPYLQDDIRFGRLTLNLGLRYELNLPVTEQRSRILAFRPGQQSQRVPGAPVGLLFQGDPGVGQIVRTDRNNWAPRFGFALDLTGDGRTSLRGGYGVFYDPVLGVIYTNTAVSLPFTVSASPASVQSFAQPFGPSSPFAPGAPPLFFPSLTQLTLVDANYATPYSQQWNFSVERSLAGFVLSAGYVGTKGTRLPGTRILNTAVFGPGANARNIDARRPYGPAFGQILNFISDLNSSYHSFQSSASRRFRNGFTLLAAYTYGKAIDQGSFPTGRLAIRVGTLPQDQNNLRGERGLSNFDQRHRFTLSGVWELPRVPLLRGWQLAAIAVVQSGSPFVIQDGSDPNVDGVASDRPDVVRNPNLPRRERTLARYWDTAAFIRVPAAANRFGNAGRNIVTGPEGRNLDASLTRSFRLTERAQAQFRWEVFNVLNRANFANPSGGSPTNDVSSPLFGQIHSTIANNERVMQFSLRFGF